MKNKLKLAVFGADEDHSSEDRCSLAFKVGQEIAKSGAILYTGGGKGIMEAVSKGAKSKNGKVIGIIPGNDKSKANQYCDEIIAQGEDFFKRSITLAQEVDGAIIIDGGIGTLSEMCVCYWDLKPIVALSTSGGMAEEYSGRFLDKRFLTKVKQSNSPEEAVQQAVFYSQNRKDLEERLMKAGLDFSIFRNPPRKFVRINPRNPIGIKKLERALGEEYGIQTQFTETSIKGIYESSNTDIGGWINGKRNNLFNRNYFIQDLASVICVNELELEENQSLLETCAARGFKSILAHDLMEGQIKITALDIDKEKYEVMLGFFKKFGLDAETHLTDATNYKGEKFDRVLVDAPCSSEGMTVSYNSELQRDVSGFDAVVQYSQGDVERFAELQGKLLQKGFEHLKDDGTLIYATCTLNREENEEVVKRFLERNPDAESIGVNMARYSVRNSQSSHGVRILPDRTKGFYFTKIKRK